VIAVRLSGHEPFTVKDVFAPPAPSEPESAPAGPDDGAAADLAAEVPASSALVGEPPAASPEPEIDAAALALEPPAAAQPETVAEPDGHDLLAGISPQPEQVAAPEPVRDHAAEQMALARTYLDMNMPDEALAPLKAACEAIRFRFEAAALLGRLHQQRGEALEAIEWFERAAEAPAPSEDEGHAVLYDLGTLVEASGDTSRALAVFLELQSDAGAYRDVVERVERLARVETGG
jgi:tetratricopeptide (TPR) repeat protein